MAEVTKYSASGSKSGTATLDDATFGIEPNVTVMHQIVTNQLATRRAGTQSTKTRSEVRGGGAKPYRQKGTGNARQGSIRAPHYSGGGVALGPKPRKYGKKAPKKMVKLALRSALSDRAADDKVIVVDAWSFDTPSTKAAKDVLAKLGVDSSALIVVGEGDDNAVLSFRNLPNVKLVEAAELNAYDVLVNEYIVFTEGTLPVADDEPKRAAAPAPAAEPVAEEAPAEEAPAEVQGFADLGDADEADAADEAADAAEATFEEAEWAGAVKADADGNGPGTHLIKGNADSMLYHVPGSSHYKRTIAEVWFDTEENAEAAGFLKPKSQRTDESDES